MKRLKSISLKEFRGFFEEQTVTFAVPNGKASSGLTVIVGPNNSGKTTILEAINRFYKNSTPQFDVEERHEEKDVELCIMNSDNEKKIIKTSGSAIGTLIGKDNYPLNNDIYFISSRRYWETYFSTESLDHDQHKNTLITIPKSGSDSNFGRRMIGIEKDPSLKKNFDSLIKILIPHFTKWNIELSRGQNYIKYVTGHSNTHSSEFFGDGITSLFKISAALIAGLDSEILIIDEPELSLHPQAQKTLLKVLSAYSKNKQIILTTHSPFFIRWSDLKNGAEFIRLDKPEDKSCTVSVLSEDVKDSLLQYIEDWQQPQLLDSAAKEIFFSEKIVFVEGKEDMSLISKFIVEENLDIDFEIFGYGSGGAGNIPTLLQMAKDLKLKAAAIFDGKETLLIEKSKKLFSPEYLITSISTDDIRDKKDKGIQGIFSEEGIIKSEHKDELKGLLDQLNKFLGEPREINKVLSELTTITPATLPE